MLCIFASQGFLWGVDRKPGPWLAKMMLAVCLINVKFKSPKQPSVPYFDKNVSFCRLIIQQ